MPPGSLISASGLEQGPGSSWKISAGFQGAGCSLRHPRASSYQAELHLLSMVMPMLMSSSPFMHWLLSARHWKCNIVVSNDVLLECKDFPILLLYPEFQVFQNSLILERPSDQTFPVNNWGHLHPYLWDERWGRPSHVQARQSKFQTLPLWGRDNLLPST